MALTAFLRKKVGQRLVEIYQAAGLTKSDFVELLGIELPTLTKIIKGEKEYSFDHLIKASEIFAMTLSELFQFDAAIPIDFREQLIEYHKNKPEFFPALARRPRLRYAIVWKVIPSGMLEKGASISEIRDFLKQYKISYKTNTITNQLTRKTGFHRKNLQK